MTSNDKIWAGKFGDDYLVRNRKTAEWANTQTLRWTGMTRMALNSLFLGGLRRDIRILEVGCNIGLQLKILEGAKFTKLCGIDVNKAAVKSSLMRKRIRVGSGQKIPFGDGTFDLVMTSGVLIHLPEDSLNKVMAEMYRVTSGLIFCREYYAVGRRECEYWGKAGLLWYDDFGRRFQILFPDLLLEKEWRYGYAKEGVLDSTFLLRKRDSEMPICKPPPKKKGKKTKTKGKAIEKRS